MEIMSLHRSCSWLVACAQCFIVRHVSSVTFRKDLYTVPLEDILQDSGVCSLPVLRAD